MSTTSSLLVHLIFRVPVVTTAIIGTLQYVSTLSGMSLDTPAPYVRPKWTRHVAYNAASATSCALASYVTIAQREKGVYLSHCSTALELDR